MLWGKQEIWYFLFNMLQDNKEMRQFIKEIRYRNTSLLQNHRTLEHFVPNLLQSHHTLEHFVPVLLQSNHALWYLHNSHAPALIVIHKYHKARHSGMDCRNPDYIDVFEITIHGTGYPIPGGYDGFLE